MLYAGFLHANREYAAFAADIRRRGRLNWHGVLVYHGGWHGCCLMQGEVLPAMLETEIHGGRSVTAFLPMCLMAVVQALSAAVADVALLIVIALVFALHAGGKQENGRGEQDGFHVFFRA